MDQRGQASVEWIGVVTLVAVVLALVLVLALPADGIASAFIRQFHRALCIVSGGVCDLDRRPCAVASSATKDDGHLNIGVIRVGRDELILYEKQSDGSVLVTYLHDTTAGLDVGVGVDGAISVRGISLSASASARAAVVSGIGGGETWRFPDVYAADGGMAALSEGHEPPRGERVEIVDDRSVAREELDATASLGKASAALGIDAGTVESVSHDPRDGSRTLVMSASASGSLVLRASKSSAAGAGGLGERVAVRMSADGRPLELSIVRTGQLEGAYSLPDVAQGIAERVVGGSGGGRTWVVESRLDLTDPGSWAAVRAYLDGVPGGADGLRTRIEQAGVTETRTYALTTKDNGTLRGHVALGEKWGFGLGETVEDLALLDARVRGSDGLWRTRDDCLAAA